MARATSFLGSFFAGASLIGCVLTSQPEGDGDGDGNGNPFGVGGNFMSGVGGDGVVGVGGDGAVGVGGGGVVGAGGGGLGTGGGGIGTGGGGPECMPVTSRCDCVVSADGISSQVDFFEDGDLTVNQIDNRDGDWFQAGTRADGTPIGTVALEAASNGENASSTTALHFHGGKASIDPPMAGDPDDWATIGVPLGLCYDASKYTGIQFWMKMNDIGTAENKQELRVSLSTPPTTEVASGGTCPNGDLGCYDHFGSTLATSADQVGKWVLRKITWAQFTQSGWGIKAPPGYAAAQNIMAINFAPINNKVPYDIWIDDISFINEDAGHCGQVISESEFKAIFPKATAAQYTYANFVEASKQFPTFCGEGTDDDKRRDAAALFAHFVQETGNPPTDTTSGLYHLTEIDKSHNYCDMAKGSCPAGALNYYGRGPLQLTWNYNYAAAGAALGLPFLEQPDTVLNGSNAFKAALWFWMTRQPFESPHTALLQGKGFGETTRLVNGPLECGTGHAGPTNRANAYNAFLGILGIADPNGPTGC